MKIQAIAAGVLLAAAAATASAQTYYGGRTYYYEPYYSAADSRQECWNPRARHFEAVRPGEYQNDLDMSRCRFIGYRGDRLYGDRYYGDRYAYRNGTHEECWNPRARHWEDVRPGEYQDDLDRSRCRIVMD